MLQPKSPFWIVTLLILTTLACSLTGGDEDPTPVVTTQLPSVTISQPQPNAVFEVGQIITVQALATDTGAGVTRVELRVNNVVVDSQTSQNPLGEQSLSVLLDYNAAVPQQNVLLTVRPYRGIVAGNDSTVTVQIVERGAATAGNTSTTTTTTGSTSTGSTTTGSTGGTTSGTTGGSTTGGSTGSTTGGAVNNAQCRVRVDVETLNFRRGPNTSYDIVGAFRLGNEVPIVGRLGDNSWWEVVSGSSRGWVSAAFTTILGDCSTVPVTTPPSSPTPVASPTPQGVNLLVARFTGAQQIDLSSGGEVVASYILVVRNNGNTTAGQFNVTTIYPNGVYYDYTVTSLAPGQEVTVPGINATFNAPGTYRIEVLVDSSGNITESNKNDNRSALDVVVTGAPQ